MIITKLYDGRCNVLDGDHDFEVEARHAMEYMAKRGVEYNEISIGFMELMNGANQITYGINNTFIFSK